MSELVEVIDIEVTVPVAALSGRPASVTYTVREHEGDVIENPLGTIVIKFAPRDIELAGGATRRLASDVVQVNLIQACIVNKRVRLEPKQKPSIAALLDPEKAVVDAIVNRSGSGHRLSPSDRSSLRLAHLP